MFALDDVESADAGADVDADHLGVFRVTFSCDILTASSAAAMAK